MKRKLSAFGFALPLVIAAVLVLGWRAPLIRGGEMLYFLAAVAIGYPCLAVFSGLLACRTGLRYVASPFVAALGYAMARCMSFPSFTGLVFGLCGLIVTACTVYCAERMWAK